MTLLKKSIRSVDSIIAPITAAIGQLDATSTALKARANGKREQAAELTNKAVVDEVEAVRASRLAEVFTNLIIDEGEIV